MESLYRRSSYGYSSYSSPSYSSYSYRGSYYSPSSSYGGYSSYRPSYSYTYRPRRSWVDQIGSGIARATDDLDFDSTNTVNGTVGPLNVESTISGDNGWSGYVGFNKTWGNRTQVFANDTQGVESLYGPRYNASIDGFDQRINCRFGLCGLEANRTEAGHSVDGYVGPYDVIGNVSKSNWTNSVNATVGPFTVESNLPLDTDWSGSVSLNKSFSWGNGAQALADDTQAVESLYNSYYGYRGSYGGSSYGYRSSYNYNSYTPSYYYRPRHSWVDQIGHAISRNTDLDVNSTNTVNGSVGPVDVNATLSPRPGNWWSGSASMNKTVGPVDVNATFSPWSCDDNSRYCAAANKWSGSVSMNKTWSWGNGSRAAMLAEETQDPYVSNGPSLMNEFAFQACVAVGILSVACAGFSMWNRKRALKKDNFVAHEDQTDHIIVEF